MESTRRTFLKQTAALSAGCLAGLESTQTAVAAVAPVAGAGEAGQQAGWYSRPMRWVPWLWMANRPTRIISVRGMTSG